MRNDYLRNPREFDGWLKANAIIGSILAIGMLAMVLRHDPMARQNSQVSRSHR